MKAAIVTGEGKSPMFGDFREPNAVNDVELISVTASALSQFSKSRSAGKHYSLEGAFPAVAGADGVGRTTDGRRVYFALPEAPFGALAERTIVQRARCVAIPEAVDDFTAAAIANPGMSAWAALVERAHIRPGETVLVNGANGSAGTIAVQLAKYLGAGKVIATGRNEIELDRLRGIGADVIIPFGLNPLQPQGADAYEEALKKEFAHGIDVVVDYLWGLSAEVVIVAIAKSVEDATPVRFVHVGGASGSEKIELPGAALRSSAIQLMGSGVKSVPLPKLLEAIAEVFKVVRTAKLQIATKTMPLPEIEHAWGLPGKPRVVMTIP